MEKIIVPQKRLIRVKPMQVASPWIGMERRLNFREKADFAEPTGKGSLLCVEGSFGRMFLSDEDCVRDELNQYQEMYQEMCDAYDERTEKGESTDDMQLALSQNDLYLLHGMIPSLAGDLYAHSIVEEYRVNLRFDIKMITEGEWAERFGRPYLYYECLPDCFPYPLYLEDCFY